MKRKFMNRPGKGRFILIPFIAAAVLALVGFIVMQLWNNILPGVAHVGAITFWQALGIFILCKLLFGFGPMRRFGKHRMAYRHKMEERVKNMTPEERAHFRERFGRHGFGRFRNCFPDSDSYRKDPQHDTEKTGKEAE